MRIRVVQMINNYYKDDENKVAASGIENNTALGEYCCLGYFDALHVELVECKENQMEQNVRTEINEIIVKKFNGNYNIRNIVCVTYDDAEDEKFWKEAEQMPYLFISLVNINCTGGQISDQLCQLIQGFNKMDHVMAYYTYDHSEIVVIGVEKSYIQGFRKMLSLYEKIKILKMYTVCAIREDILEESEQVNEETIDCRLYGTVKKWNKVGEFKQKLADDLGKKVTEIKVYETLGNSDCLMEIPQISIKRMLCCYRMGRLLTHTNEYYNKAFFNIESQFLIEEEENESMGN